MAEDTARRLFGSYDRFLAILDDESKRTELATATHEQLEKSQVWEEISNLSREFQSGLTALFFEDNEELRELTKFYGVF